MATTPPPLRTRSRTLRRGALSPVSGSTSEQLADGSPVGARRPHING